MIACTQCISWHETKWMQLRTTTGYRAIHCRNCKTQQRVAYNTCQCGSIWHQCEWHGRDPDVHYSRKAPSKKGAEAKKEDKKLSSKRKAPRTHDGPKDSTKHKNARKRKHRGGGSSIRHIKVKMSQAPPNANLIQRVRARVEQQRISNETSRSNVAQRLRQVNDEEQKVSYKWSRDDPMDTVTQVQS